MKVPKNKFKNTFLILAICLLGVISCGRKPMPSTDKTTTNSSNAVNCLNAKGPDLLETKSEVKYGTPLCVKVEGVNVFLMKTYATYSPVNFDFSTKGFLDINLAGKPEITDVPVKTDEIPDSMVNMEAFKMAFLIQKENDIFKEIKALKLKETDSLITDADKKRIIELEKLLEEYKRQVNELKVNVSTLTKNNEALKRQYDSIFNVVTQSQKFKAEFINFQKHFTNIDKYTALKGILLKQINKDSVFVKDVENFKARSTSSYNATYESAKDHLEQKSKIVEELNAVGTSYLNLVAIFEQLNVLYKNKELKLSGELKDGKNVLKFDKIKASFETKYLFEEEMKKVKTINDSLIQPKIRTKIIEEAQAGIDLYDEIQTSDFTTTIISDNVYNDSADIKLQLKNKKGKVMHEYREFKVRSYGNWKVNGSAGYFLNFISDDNYTIRKKVETVPGSQAGVTEGSSNSLKHSLGGLLHAYYNFKGSFDLGASVGLSINDNANAGFYLGLSAFCTEKNRLVITSGLSFNKVKRINTSNLVFDDTAKQYNFSNESDTEIKYDEVYKPAFFIGISYNLF